ncbi:MAG: hypothetical protein R3354_07730 [Thiohalomonadales bacterium]|nr:hypothetical protein [Thiohalomonadales bacterium]
MSLNFSTEPGPRERQLRRKYHNPLFAPSGDHITQQEVNTARQQDLTALQEFLQDFQTLIQEAVDLKPNTDSEIILDLKERLDQCYTRCCAMPGEQEEIKTAINKLLQVIMQAVRQGAANDPMALDKLDDEETARRMHQALHIHPLIVDLLLPDSPIEEPELLPTLLSESAEAVQATLPLFDAEQLRLLYKTGKHQLEQLQQAGHDMTAAWNNLALFEKQLLETTNSQPN